MSVIKSLSVGLGDMFYIKHGSSNFTIIDCCLSELDKEEIVTEIIREKASKDITRFVSTHPDEDHIQRLNYLDDRIEILNFYCAENDAIKDVDTPGFARYKELRDSEKAFFIYEGCSRKWMNSGGEGDKGKDYGSAGLNILWPKVDNTFYKSELEKANTGTAFNNMSCIIKYSIQNGATALWMGDLETEFMNNIVDEISFPKINILFAPHHGRKSSRVPDKWIKAMDPDMIVMGEANANNSDYAAYPEHNKIRQNSGKNLTFNCLGEKIHCYSSNPEYSADFLDYENGYPDCKDYYFGTFNLKDV